MFSVTYNEKGFSQHLPIFHQKISFLIKNQFY